MVYLIRYAEIAIKGKNRPLFEKQLVRNIEQAARWYGKTITTIKRLYGRILVYGTDLDCLRTVFGVSSISSAQEIPPDIEQMKQAALSLVPKEKPTSFKIHTQRLDKSYPYKSPEINEIIGEFVHEATKIPCKFKNPALTIYIEIFNNHSYLFTKKIQGFGGLPVGVEGSAKLAVTNDADILAGLLMMKRGARLNLTRSDTDTTLLEAFGHHDTDSTTRFSISAETLKNVENYAPTTFYPLIAYTKDKIQNELENYRRVFNTLRNQN